MRILFFFFPFLTNFGFEMWQNHILIPLNPFFFTESCNFIPEYHGQ